MIKLDLYLEEVTEVVKKYEKEIIELYEYTKKLPKPGNVDTRVMFKVYYCLVPKHIKVSITEDTTINDNHIETLMKQAFKKNRLLNSQQKEGRTVIC